MSALMEGPAAGSSEGTTSAPSPRTSSLAWRISRYVLLVLVSAALSELFHVEFFHKVSENFIKYASQIQPLALAGDFFSIVTTGQEPEGPRSYSAARSMAESAQDIADATRRLYNRPSSQSLPGALMRIPRATWYVLKKSLSQGWVSFVAIGIAILLGFRSALRNNGPEVGFLLRVITIAAAPAIGIGVMALLLLAAVGVAALTTSLVSFFSVIFSPAILVGSVKEERIHSFAEGLAHKLQENPHKPKA